MERILRAGRWERFWVMESVKAKGGWDGEEVGEG